MSALDPLEEQPYAVSMLWCAVFGQSPQRRWRNGSAVQFHRLLLSFNGQFPQSYQFVSQDLALQNPDDNGQAVQDHAKARKHVKYTYGSVLSDSRRSYNNDVPGG